MSPSRGRIREEIENSAFCTMENCVGTLAAVSVSEDNTNEIRHGKICSGSRTTALLFFLSRPMNSIPGFLMLLNLSLLYLAGLQHPRQRRAALSGTLQSASHPPRTGTSSNADGALEQQCTFKAV